MHPIAVLRFCRDVLDQRQRTDHWQGWFWAIRRKVIDYWIARLERDLDSADSVPELDLEEQQLVRQSHPLLAARPVMAGSVPKIESLWRVELEGRVRRYVDTLRAQH